MQNFYALCGGVGACLLVWGIAALIGLFSSRQRSDEPELTNLLEHYVVMHERKHDAMREMHRIAQEHERGRP